MTIRITSIIGVAVALYLVTPVQAYLHPQMGRFMQRDPIGYADGASLYETTRSSPLKKLIRSEPVYLMRIAPRAVVLAYEEISTDV